MPPRRSASVAKLDPSTGLKPPEAVGSVTRIGVKANLLDGAQQNEGKFPQGEAIVSTRCFETRDPLTHASGPRRILRDLPAALEFIELR